MVARSDRLQLDGSLGLVELNNREVEQVEGGIVGALAVGAFVVGVAALGAYFFLTANQDDGNLTRIDR